MTAKPVHVVCTIDDAYIQHCAVMLTSLFSSNRDTAFSIYIITDLSESSNLTKLKQFLNQYQHFYSIITIDKSAISNAPVTHHLSLATYFRLFIPKVLPRSLNKVLFLDADMIIRQQIDSLWKINLESYTHAAVIAAGMDSYPPYIGLPENSLYFNAGMLLINLQAWRDLKVFERGCDLIQREPERLKWMDQDVLNILLHDAWLLVDLTWNAQPFLYEKSFNDEFEFKQRYEDFNSLQAKTDPAIVHYVGGERAKPWHYYCQHPFKDEYTKYLKITPWKHVEAIGKPNLIEKIRFQLGLGTKLRSLRHSLIKQSS